MGKWLATFVEQRPRIVVLWILGILALVAGVVVIAPAFVSLAIAVVTAGGWCVWLEKSAGSGADVDTVNRPQSEPRAADRSSSGLHPVRPAPAPRSASFP